MNKPTLTIGIPAYNEERNIGFLLESITAQEHSNYTLEVLHIICDGCTDDTVKVAQTFADKYPFIKISHDPVRKGKADALNKLYGFNTSDYLLTIDADLVLIGKTCIDTMMKEAVDHPELLLLGPRHIPVMPETMMGKFAYYSYVSFEDAFLKINDGNNFYAMMAVGLISNKLVQTLRYPKGTISDQCYLFAAATVHDKHAFKLVKDSQVYFSPVRTFQDWRILGVRSVSGDKDDVVKHFGSKVLEDFYMPRNLYIKSLIKFFFKNPFYMTGSVLMNIFVRKFPYTKNKPKDGMWTLAESSKVGIKV